MEISAALSLNLRQFNILPRIALFVCNIGPFSLVPDAKADNRSHEFTIGMQSECATDTTKSDQTFVTSLVIPMPSSKLFRENEF